MMSHATFIELSQRLLARAWSEHCMGAEGPYYIKTVAGTQYKCQLIQQTEEVPSVYNINRNIPGQQNLHIFIVCGHHTLFFGHCSTAQDLDLILGMLGLDAPQHQNPA